MHTVVIALLGILGVSVLMFVVLALTGKMGWALTGPVSNATQLLQKGFSYEGRVTSGRFALYFGVAPVKGFRMNALPEGGNSLQSGFAQVGSVTLDSSNVFSSEVGYNAQPSDVPVVITKAGIHLGTTELLGWMWNAEENPEVAAEYAPLTENQWFRMDAMAPMYSRFVEEYLRMRSGTNATKEQTAADNDVAGEGNVFVFSKRQTAQADVEIYDVRFSEEYIRRAIVGFAAVFPQDDASAQEMAGMLTQGIMNTHAEVVATSFPQEERLTITFTAEDSSMAGYDASQQDAATGPAVITVTIAPLAKGVMVPDVRDEVSFSSVILKSLETARQKARDAMRVANLNSVKVALAIYYDMHMSYPGTLAALLEEGVAGSVLAINNTASTSEPANGEELAYLPMEADGRTACARPYDGPCPGYLLGASLERGDSALLADDVDTNIDAGNLGSFFGNDAFGCFKYEYDLKDERERHCFAVSMP